jgi:hypothetical protein
MSDAVASELYAVIQELIALNKQTCRRAMAAEKVLQKWHKNLDLAEEYRQQEGRVNLEQTCASLDEAHAKLRASLHLPGRVPLVP